MPARIHRIRHDDNTRAKIKAAQLINRLTDHAMGKIELSASQVRSIEILLKKILPDLQATTISTDGEGVLAQILNEISGKDTGLPKPVDESRELH
jgi:hypothetical protein